MYRNDLLKILARKEFVKIAARNNSEAYINTIFGQRNLSPVSNFCVPKFTGFDDALDLFTLPDVLFLCDNLCETENAHQNMGRTVFTVGSVLRNNCFLEVDYRTMDSRIVMKDKFIC